MSDSRLKFQGLLENLAGGPNLAVACSGGVDSTLLLYAAVKALPPQRVSAWHCRSTLGAAAALAGYRQVLAQGCFAGIRREELTVDPLSWAGLAENTGERCYLCKKGMYRALQAALVEGFVLADGTNQDDLLTDRPGLRAIRELQVLTPLADADLGKEDIRTIAREEGLLNHDWPANSCLATRIPTDTPITPERLLCIDKAETFLQGLGILGCRVRLHGPAVLLELSAADIEKCLERAQRTKILEYFQALGLGAVHLNLTGRCTLAAPKGDLLKTDQIIA